MSRKTKVFEKTREKVNAKRVERHERWANRFPFNMLHDMWRGFTGEPR